MVPWKRNETRITNNLLLLSHLCESINFKLLKITLTAIWVLMLHVYRIFKILLLALLKVILMTNIWKIPFVFCIYFLKTSLKEYEKVYTAQWESALVVRGQIFEHSINYFTVWKITKMLISQPNFNRFVFCKKTPKCLSFASVFKHSPHF